MAKARGRSIARRRPPWVERLALPVWVSSAQGSLHFVNSRAEKLLGIRARQVIGVPCHQVVRSTDESGQPFCTRRCPIRRLLFESNKIEPVRVHLGSAKGGTWAFLLVLPIGDKSGRCSSLVHCALPCEREHRIEEYLKGVAHHSAGMVAQEVRSVLTPRERDVLEKLVMGRELRDLSLELHMSYSTARNHVQHILPKLGVHSIQEAVALWLLQEQGEISPSGRHTRG